MAFNHKYNTDDSIIRSNIVGLLNELNNQIRFENVWEDDRKQIVRVPFFYAMSGDERFLQDYFSNWSDCVPDFIEGNTDPIPRGTIYLSGYSVLAQNMTSRFIRGYYTKEVNGELKRFNSYINSIPIQLNFTAEILVDTQIDSFKVTQAITQYLYRTQVFSVNFKGFRVPTQVGFPDSYVSTKQFEYSYGESNRLKVTFDIELQSYLPVVDELNEFFGGNQITGYSYTYNVGATSNNTPPTTPSNGTITPANIPVGSTGSEINNYTNASQDSTYNGNGNVNNGNGNGNNGNTQAGGENDPNSQFGGDYWT